jgi:protease IV
VRDYELKARFSDLPFLHAAAMVALDAVGLTALERRIEGLGTVAEVERFNLDGLLALWHPAGAN